MIAPVLLFAGLLLGTSVAHTIATDSTDEVHCITVHFLNLDNHIEKIGTRWELFREGPCSMHQPCQDNITIGTGRISLAQGDGYGTESKGFGKMKCSPVLVTNQCVTWEIQDLAPNPTGPKPIARIAIIPVDRLSDALSVVEIRDLENPRKPANHEFCLAQINKQPSNYIHCVGVQFHNLPDYDKEGLRWILYKEGECSASQLCFGERTQGSGKILLASGDGLGTKEKVFDGGCARTLQSNQCATWELTAGGFERKKGEHEAEPKYSLWLDRPTNVIFDVRNMFKGQKPATRRICAGGTPVDDGSESMHPRKKIKYAESTHEEERQARTLRAASSRLV